MLLFVLLLLLSFAVAFYMLRPTKTETAVQQQLVDIQDTRAEERGETILKMEGYSSNPEVSRVVREIPGAPETLALIQQAGLNWTVASVMGICVLALIITAWISSLFLPGLILPGLAGVIAATIPYIYILVTRELRFRKCDQLLPEAIDLMARALRAGHSLPAVLEMVADEIPDPISTEFRRLHEENSLGIPLREATLNLVSRLPRDDVRFLATAILLQKETGSNLAVILDKTCALARERARLRGQLKIYTAQGRITGWILCIMPFVMFGLLSALNWNLEKLLITEPAGRFLVYTGLGLMLFGILVIRKIIDVKV
jgi:tight adherence protein B